jgi:hypothetical protein
LAEDCTGVVCDRDGGGKGCGIAMKFGVGGTETATALGIGTFPD